MREKLLSLSSHLKRIGLDDEARNVNRLINHTIDKYAVMAGSARGTSQCSGNPLVEEVIPMEKWGISFLPRSGGIEQEQLQTAAGLKPGMIPFRWTSTLKGYNPKTQEFMATAASSQVETMLSQLQTKYESTILYANLKQRARVIGKRGVGFEKDPSNARGIELIIEMIVQLKPGVPVCKEIVEEYQNENQFLFKVTSGESKPPPPPRQPPRQPPPAQNTCLPPCECICPEETVERGEAVINVRQRSNVSQRQRRSDPTVNTTQTTNVSRRRRRSDPTVNTGQSTEIDPE